MSEKFREYLDRLRELGELKDIKQPVDIRHIAALTAQAKTALFFHDIIGYDMPVVSGLMQTSERFLAAMDCANFAEMEAKLTHAMAQPIAPKMVNGSPAREVVMSGDDVDLYKLPIPMCSVYDGGPVITAGVVIARDPEFGMNAGIYRFMLKEKNLTGIDIVTPNNMRLFAQRALATGKPFPISISIGTHPFELMGGIYRAPAGVDEMGFVGGLRGEAVALAPCETIDMPYIADAEIVLEAEILPTGWTWPEGRFGEFTHLMGGLHWNPLVRVKSVSMRKDAIYYALHMPWEVITMTVPPRHIVIRQAMKTAGITVHEINVTMGGCGLWHAIVSIKKQAGEGKNAVMAALSTGLKYVVIVDDDIDVNDPTEVDWAIAMRVQADRDVTIITEARAKPLDPSLRPVPAGTVPTTAVMGIDATRPDGIPAERYQRISYAYMDKVKIDDYVNGAVDKAGKTAAAADIPALAEEILALLEKQPIYYTEIAEHFSAHNFQSVARALGYLHAKEKLWQDSVGRACVRGSAFDAKAPG
jgi:2,5-furandicarboxylate decarboxylase 1